MHDAAAVLAGVDLRVVLLLRRVALVDAGDGDRLSIQGFAPHVVQFANARVRRHAHADDRGTAAERGIEGGLQRLLEGVSA